jgi:LysM repeat protein
MELRGLETEMPRGARGRFGGEFRLDPRKKSLILKAAGLLLLIILLMVFFGGGSGDKDAAKELEAVKSSLEGLEKHLARFEALEQKVFSSGRQIGELQATVISLEMATKSLEAVTSSMKNQMEKLAQPAVPNPQGQSAPPKKKPASVERQLHEVRRGETLFGISKKYGMSADELRRLNHLSENSIQPGQRLVVYTGK